MRLRILTLLTMTAFLLAAAPGAFAGPAMDQMRATVEKMFDILEDPELQKPENKDTRRDLLKDTLNARFDFEKMSMSAVGRKWRKFTNPQKVRFAELFRQVLEKTYLKRIEAYHGEKLTFTKEKARGRVVRVDSILTHKGEEYPFSYDMIKSDGEWKVYDVMVLGIRLTANYRKQFQQKLSRGSVDKLLQELEAKVNKPGPDPDAPPVPQVN